VSFVECVTTVLPAHELSLERVRELARSVLHGKVAFLDQALGLFDHAGVESRHLVRDVEVLLENRSLEWRNGVYIEECRRMGIQLLGDLLEQTATRPEEIDVLITTSCTGFMIPALDADLINHFRLRADVRRLPFTELGCAAGAMALSRAHDHLRAYPDHRVAIVAIEIPSMTFLSGDLSAANLVSAALFGDGGAAALVRGDRGPFEILDARTHFFHDTPEMMGFHVTDQGFSIVLDKRVPQLLERELPAAVESFLARNGVTRAELRSFLFHPGGRKILDTVRDLFALTDDDLAWSRETLREVGNLSSASVLWVLGKALAGRDRPGLSLVAAFGPGFNAELLLGRLG
jgi:predicted naringenin-chalcone synthase